MGVASCLRFFRGLGRFVTHATRACLREVNCKSQPTGTARIPVFIMGRQVTCAHNSGIAVIGSNRYSVVHWELVNAQYLGSVRLLFEEVSRRTQAAREKIDGQPSRGESRGACG